MKPLLLVSLFGLALGVVAQVAYVRAGMVFSLLVAGGYLLALGILFSEAHSKEKR